MNTHVIFFCIKQKSRGKKPACVHRTRLEYFFTFYFFCVKKKTHLFLRTCVKFFVLILSFGAPARKSDELALCF